MRSEMSVEIDRPIEHVFEYTNNHVPEWSLIVVEEEILNEVPGMVGSTFRIVTEERGQRMTFDGETTVYEPPHRSAIVMRGKHFDIEAEYLFEDLGGRTRLTQKSVVNGKGFTKVMFLLFSWMMKRSSCNALRDELNSLKKHAEAYDPATAGA